MKSTCLATAAFCLIAGTLELAAAPWERMVWVSPSVDSLDSMPLSGRLGAGANVWVQDGSIWFYLGHNGAYDAHGRLLKLGALRITPQDAKLGETGFAQTLDPATGTISISQGSGFKANLWFAGETLVFESQSSAPEALEVAYGTRREKTKDGIRNDMMGAKTTFNGDQIQASPGGFLAFHRNADYAIDLNSLAQSRGSALELLPDVTARRVSGSAIAIEGGMTGQPVESDVRWQFWNGKAWSGTTAPRENRRAPRQKHRCRRRCLYRSARRLGALPHVTPAFLWLSLAPIGLAFDFGFYL